ncbi:ABC transporter permease [Propionibacterium freudenreichii]|uniref:ABC transporter permease n=1 Tax=Propionibacterium freudenreichii TaxID=1744 RepID=UPI0010215D30|nr:ABC transporter permease [Propionibacterium freudenreichii]MDK9646797.1 ABC transporter permease [Propionibacterium freudenreichii]MDK9655622.1 ABC transporter permease [Propionibacterium freudenreichii]MDK9666699.1 ABC transporter permease [Propionibacterium freudenreichii]
MSSQVTTRALTPVEGELLGELADPGSPGASRAAASRPGATTEGDASAGTTASSDVPPRHTGIRALLDGGPRGFIRGLTRPGALGRHRALILGTAGIVALGAVWQTAVGLRILNPEIVPGVGATLAELVRLVGLPGFYVTLGQTLLSAGVGLVLALVIAVPVGLALASSAWLRRLLNATIDALRPIPPIVLLPLAILAIGGGLGFKVTLVLQGALWPLLLQTSYGLRAVDPLQTDVAASFRIDPLRRLFLFRIPAAAPVIFSGLRLAASTAFGVSVMTELVGGERGLGSILAIAQSGNNVPRVYAITIITGLVGLAIAFFFGRLERLLLPWQEATR